LAEQLGALHWVQQKWKLQSGDTTGLKLCSNLSVNAHGVDKPGRNVHGSHDCRQRDPLLDEILVLDLLVIVRVDPRQRNGDSALDFDFVVKRGLVHLLPDELLEFVLVQVPVVVLVEREEKGLLVGRGGGEEEGRGGGRLLGIVDVVVVFEEGLLGVESWWLGLLWLRERAGGDGEEEEEHGEEEEEEEEHGKMMRVNFAEIDSF